MINHFFKLNRDREVEEIAYRHRFMGGMVIVLLAMLLVVKFWPVRQTSEEPSEQPVIFQDNVFLEHIEITRQESSPPPPPRPQQPVPVPDDVIIDDLIELDLSIDLAELAPLEGSSGSGRTGDDPVIVGRPQLPPTVVKIVEPHVPDIPGNIKGRIEIVVNFLVNETGGVEEVAIVQIRLYNNDFSNFELQDTIGYGIMDATIEAAMEWQFRAARHEGAGVWAYTTQRFNY